MWLGRFQLGDTVDIDVQGVDGNDAPGATAAPTVRVYAADGTLVDTDVIVPRILEYKGKAALFRLPLFLGSDYAAGKYCVRGSFTVGGNTKRPLYFFEILPGGNAKGAYRALAFYDKTGGEHLVGETDSGDLEIRQGPYL